MSRNIRWEVHNDGVFKNPAALFGILDGKVAVIIPLHDPRDGNWNGKVSFVERAASMFIGGQSGCCGAVSDMKSLLYSTQNLLRALNKCFQMPLHRILARFLCGNLVELAEKRHRFLHQPVTHDKYPRWNFKIGEDAFVRCRTL